MSQKNKLRILIAGNAVKVKELLPSILGSEIEEMYSCGSAAQARTILQEESIDLLIINAPLADESGYPLAKDMAESNMAVLMLLNKQMYAVLRDKAEQRGILTLAKPNTVGGFRSAVRLAAAFSSRLSSSRKAKQSLEQKMKDLSTINHAKWLLIEHLHLSEEAAHRYLEKEAMDNRLPRRKVAENIIGTYQRS